MSAAVAAPDKVQAPAEYLLPTVAVLTMTRDEGPMLARWVDFYASAVGMENLLILDDNSIDGSTDDLACAVYRLPGLPGGQQYERTRMHLVNGFGDGLLACHDFVIFVDVDEFLIPDPARHASLRHFLAARRDVPVIAPTALNVVHHLALEGRIDQTRPVLEQRSFAKFVPLMCKPSIKQTPVRWRAAAHAIRAPFRVDPELFMLHLKFFDRDTLRIRGDHRNAMVHFDGRAPRSSWSRTGERLAHLLNDFVRGSDPADVPEFDPSSVDLLGVVEQGQGETFHAAAKGQGQVRAMRERDLVRIPERLVGLL